MSAESNSGSSDISPASTEKEPDPKPETAFIISQLQQHVETYRMILTITVQILTVLVLGNVTLVGYAISQQIAGILLIGPLFPVGIIITVFLVGHFAMPIIYSYLNLERKFGGDWADWLGKTFFSYMFTAKFVSQMLEAGSLPDWDKRYTALKKMPMVVVGTGKGIIRACLALVAVGQVAAAIVLWLYFDWRMF